MSQVDQNDHYTDHMVRQLTATDTKARLLALLDQVEQGEEIEVTRRGRTIARIVPAGTATGLKGRFAGVAKTVVDENLLYATDLRWDVDR
jgi:prevent-host-death family protein